MTFQPDIEIILTQKLNTFQRVRELQDWQAIAFSAALLERMIPNYQLFCELSNFGDPTHFRNCLTVIWEHLSNSKSKINFAVQLEKVEQAIPDAADFDHFGVYPAIDAGISLAATIQLIMQEDQQGAVVVSKLSQGGVEAFIEASAEAELSNDDIKAHPLMQWEISFQQALLDKLTGLKANKEGAVALKAFALEEGMSNIGLELSE